MTELPLEDLNNIRKKILEDIKPTPAENAFIKKVVEETSDIIRNWNKKHDNYSIELIQPQGSTGIKQTHLKNAADVDLFILLDPYNYSNFIDFSLKKKRIELNVFFKKLCTEWIIPSLEEAKYSKVNITYAEHPYVSALSNGIEIDIVFAFLLNEDYLLKNGPITAVDRTFYHSKFINENLSEDQLDDVRILKKFFKTQFSYGDIAPIGRGGFIGYSSELLIYHFGNIWNLFKNFHELPSIPVDFFNRSEKELRSINRFKRDLLMIIDPTDNNRNVASAIAPRAWIHCSKIILEFLKKPNTDIILKKNIKNIDKNSDDINKNYVICEFLQNNEDHYSKIRDKLYSLSEDAKNQSLKEMVGENRFNGVEYSIYFNPNKKIYTIAFHVDSLEISKEYTRMGPKANNSIDHQKFSEKNTNMFEKDGYCYVVVQRKYTNFLQFITKFIKSKLFKEIDYINISLPKNNKFDESIYAISMLKYNILPYVNELNSIISNKIKISKKKPRKRRK